MVATAFSCPHCSATLRIQDRALLGRQLDCPDCAGPILIESDGRHGFAAVAAGAALPQAQTPISEPATTWKALATSPVVVGWTVAVGSALGLFAFMNSGGDDEYAVTTGTHEVQTGEADGASQGPDETDVGETDSVAAAVEEKVAESEPSETDPTVTARSDANANVDEQAHAAPQQPDESGLAAPEPVAVGSTAEPASPAAPKPRGASPPNPAAVPPRSASAGGSHSFSSPLEPVVAPKPLDVASALLQPIASYRTTQPVPLGTLLRELEDMAGIPIHTEGLLVSNKPITVRLESTSVGDILRVVLEQAGLSYTSNVDGVRLHAVEEPLESSGP